LKEKVGERVKEDLSKKVQGKKKEEKKKKGD